MKKYTRYALLDAETGDYATLTHQDDMETPIVADDLDGLLDLMGTWADMGIGSIGKRVTDYGTAYVDGRHWQIVRETVEQEPLTAGDRTQLAALPGDEAEDGD